MATVSITIPDVLIPRLIAAGRASYPQYNELGPAQAFRAITADYWRYLLVNHESSTATVAANTVREAAISTARAQAVADGEGIA